MQGWLWTCELLDPRSRGVHRAEFQPPISPPAGDELIHPVLFFHPHQQRQQAQSSLGWMDGGLDDTSETSDKLAVLFARESLNRCFHLSQSTALEAVVILFAGLGKKPRVMEEATFLLVPLDLCPVAWEKDCNPRCFKPLSNPGHKKLWSHEHSLGGVMWPEV